MYTFFTCCSKEEDPTEEEVIESLDCYFTAKINYVDSKATSSSISVWDPNNEVLWIIAEEGSSGFKRGAIIIKIHEVFFDVNSFNLDSSIANLYLREFVKHSSYYLRYTVLSTANTATNGTLIKDVSNAPQMYQVLKMYMVEFSFMHD